MRLQSVEVVKDYVFDDPEQPERGELRLLDLFDGRRQLVVYHAMWVDDEGLACPSCSAFLDQVGHVPPLNTRDTTFAAISRGPLDLMRGFKRRMEWSFPWYSSRRSDFNYDFHVTFDERRAPIEYDYRHKHELEAAGFNLADWPQPFDLQGVLVFLRDGDRVFHTYSTYARGVDNLGFGSDVLDLTVLGTRAAPMISSA